MKSWLLRVAIACVLVALAASVGCTPRSSQTASPGAASESSAAVTPSSSATRSAAPTCSADASGNVAYSKPAIYLYPPRRTEVCVRLAVDGIITRTDPSIDPVGGWRVLADPSGLLTDPTSGRRFPYLFWEADAANRFDMSTGFVVRGSDTRRFLAGKLAALGLSTSEADAFREYWVPRMESNKYNLVHFEGPAYERTARLLVAPHPDTQIRVFMVFKPLTAPVEVAPQRIESPAPRCGFVLVEWGGAEIAGP